MVSLSLSNIFNTTQALHTYFFHVMGEKQRKTPAEPVADTDTSHSVASASFDPALSSLFASSAGPVKVPERPVANTASHKQHQSTISDLPTPEETPSGTESSSESDGTESSEGEAEPEQEPPRKRRRVENEELEDAYFRKLADAEQRDLKQRQGPRLDQEEDEVSDSPSNDLEDLSEDEDVIHEDSTLPIHESLAGTQDQDLSDKTNRTIFLSNVSTAAVKEKTSRKTLLAHLKSAIPKEPPAKVETIRFRSTPYASGVGPKRAAYATKALMDETAAATHAYVVLSSEPAAKAIASKLNGTVVLDRHLHVEHLGAPSQVDHRRCVFVGNLPFVDEETLEVPDEDNPRKRPRAKLRDDAEEGLWRAFGKAGKVENVRMVRDKTTRIGKGFAYVQFTTENAVEAALLMHDKKFPPLLPRKLRVSRSKKPSSKPKQAQARGKPDDRKARGKEVQKTRSRRMDKDKNFGRDLKKIVFEGHRASKASAKDKAVKTKPKKKPKTRSANRGAAFKAGGGKKKRDMK